MARVRQQRVAEAVRHELGSMLQREVKDPRLGFVSIVEVEMSKDLRYAKVHASIFGDAKDRENSLRALESAKGLLRTKLAQRLKLRYAPEITFVVDESIEHGARIANLLRELEGE